MAAPRDLFECRRLINSRDALHPVPRGTTTITWYRLQREASLARKPHHSISDSSQLFIHVKTVALSKGQPEKLCCSTSLYDKTNNLTFFPDSKGPSDRILHKLTVATEP